MEADILDIRNFVAKARVRRIFTLLASSFLRSLSAAIAVATVVILGDAIFGFSLGWRELLRWLALLGAAGLFLFEVFRRKMEFKTSFTILELERHFKEIERFDPLSNAWSFSEVIERDVSLAAVQPSAMPVAKEPRFALENIPAGKEGFNIAKEGIWEELALREMQRAARFIVDVKKRLHELYGARSVLKKTGTPALMVFILSPLLIFGAGMLTQAGADTLMGRFLFPYKQIESIVSFIELEPPPGRYKPIVGTPQSIRVTLKAPKPPGWQDPKLWIQGESYLMAEVGGDKNSQSFVYTIAGLMKPIKMQLTWGEFESAPWIFEPVALPEIEEIVFKIEPPSYAASLAKTIINPSAIRVLKGSALHVAGKAAVPIASVHGFLESESGSRKVLSLTDLTGKNFAFSFAPHLSSFFEPKQEMLPSSQNADRTTLRLAIEDQEHRINASAWASSLEILDDFSPSVAIMEPLFSEVQMDMGGELGIFWEASDGVGLLSVAAVGVLEPPGAGAMEKVLWKASDQNTKYSTSANGVYTFRPRQWSLKTGDRIHFYLKALDNYPERKEPSRSKETLTITVTDFAGRHRENLEQSNEKLKEEMLAHLEEGLSLSTELESKDPSKTPERLAKYEIASRELSRKLESHAKALEQDPLASPKWSWGMKKLSQAMDAARSAHLNQASERLAKQDFPQAAKELERYLEEMEKSAAAFGELKKEQKMSDAVSSAQKLEDLTSRLEKELGDAKSMEEMENLLSELDQEFNALSQALSKMSPEEFPQEFVNQISAEDLPVGKVADARKELAEALKSRDLEKAKQAVKKMLESLKKMRANLEEASQKYREKPQKLLGSGSGEGGDGKEKTIAQDLDEIRQSQEKLLWKTSSVDQAVRRRRAEKKDKAYLELNPQELQSLHEQAKEQKDIAFKTQKLLSELGNLDREYPTLLLSSLVTKLEMVMKDQEAAQKGLEAKEIAPALSDENNALKKLEDMSQMLKDLAEEMARSGSLSGGQPGGTRPLVVVPSMGLGQGGAGQQGIRLGPVRIPKPEDYKVPPQQRQEILKSLQERVPRSMEEEVNDYLKGLLK